MPSPVLVSATAAASARSAHRASRCAPAARTWPRDSGAHAPVIREPLTPLPCSGSSYHAHHTKSSRGARRAPQVARSGWFPANSVRSPLPWFALSATGYARCGTMHGARPPERHGDGSRVLDELRAIVTGLRLHAADPAAWAPETGAACAHGRRAGPSERRA